MRMMIACARLQRIAVFEGRGTVFILEDRVRSISHGLALIVHVSWHIALKKVFGHELRLAGLRR